jgi:hypothetical protein
MTLDALAHALRGMPGTAPIMVRMPDGELRPVRLVTATYTGGNSRERVQPAKAMTIRHTESFNSENCK